jgi:fused signal recognition particle receptor
MQPALVEPILLGIAALGLVVALGAFAIGFPRSVRESARRRAREAARGPAAPSRAAAVVAPASPALPAPPEPEEAPDAAFLRSLRRTRSAVAGRLQQLLRGAPALDPATLDRVEEVLFAADLGVRTAETLMQSAREARHPDRLRAALEARALAILRAVPAGEAVHGRPHVVLVVGVNGSGKTTTIGKLAARHLALGERVLIAACDTFRAAAIDQLEIWAHRVGATLVKGKPGGDPASVAFDALQAGKGRGADTVIVDTAGRLQTDQGLMDELRKIARVVKKEIPDAPHEVLLVLDANTGQNAIRQAQQFKAAVEVTGIVLTKLDGTAKGGVVLGIAEETGIPVRWVGVGEGVHDLREFDPELFVRALFAEEREGRGGGEELRAGA